MARRGFSLCVSWSARAAYHPHGISQSVHPKIETTTNHARAMASAST